MRPYLDSEDLYYLVKQEERKIEIKKDERIGKISTIILIGLVIYMIGIWFI
jgi:hypothetical protein